jgi:hypothetical protein
MKEEKTDIFFNALRILLAVISLWAIGTSTTYRFKHPEKTETEIFLQLPKILLLDFEE